MEESLWNIFHMKSNIWRGEWELVLGEKWARKQWGWSLSLPPHLSPHLSPHLLPTSPPHPKQAQGQGHAVSQGHGMGHQGRRWGTKSVSQGKPDLEPAGGREEALWNGCSVTSLATVPSLPNLSSLVDAKWWPGIVSTQDGGCRTAPEGVKERPWFDLWKKPISQWAQSPVRR